MTSGLWMKRTFQTFLPSFPCVHQDASLSLTSPGPGVFANSKLQFMLSLTLRKETTFLISFFTNKALTQGSWSQPWP